MRNKTTFAILCAAVSCLWLAVLATYASENKLGTDKTPLMPTQSANCSSSSSSSE